MVGEAMCEAQVKALLHAAGLTGSLTCERDLMGNGVIADLLASLSTVLNLPKASGRAGAGSEASADFEGCGSWLSRVAVMWNSANPTIVAYYQQTQAGAATQSALSVVTWRRFLFCVTPCVTPEAGFVENFTSANRPNSLNLLGCPGRSAQNE